MGNWTPTEHAQVGALHYKRSAAGLGGHVIVDGLAPKGECMALFREIVLDVWNRCQDDARRVARQLEWRVAELRARKTNLVEAGIYRKAIDERTLPSSWTSSTSS